MELEPDWSLSVVSHGHDLEPVATHLAAVLDSPERVELIATWNLPGTEQPLSSWPGRLTRRSNSVPRGFGANHNAALAEARGRYVATLDPDLIFRSNPFPALAQALDDPTCGFATPAVIDDRGQAADHARSLPNPMAILARKFWPGASEGVHDTVQVRNVDWIAGLFMACRRETFQRLGGFDDRYFMYCEDVDLCLRCWNASLAVRVLPTNPVEHKARRQTLKNPRHFLWHCTSLFRLWTSTPYQTFVSRKQRGLELR